MSIPTYAFANDVPPPVTTGTAVQFFTDVMGEVWVARNGVNGGAWARARAVLYCRCYRSAAYTSPAINTPFAFDTAVDDVYGLFAAPNITVPIPGQWMAGATIEIVPTTTSDTCAFYLNMGAGNSLRSGSAAATSALNPIRAVHSAVANVPAAAVIGVATEYLTAGRSVAVADGRSMLWAKYVGA